MSGVNAAGLRAHFEGIELVAPVTMTDLDELRSHARTVYDGASIEVVLRGTPDRKCDGDHRVEIVVDGARIELLVTSAA